eukprot:TRINITY_DN15441_c0_g1_i1.p1 TRINITY_DN15441_c0_g1~~TRINITY_DN15441_c0_g1_i1.p1  ORF type:complete len:264 (-),score=50.27 TRINITY_DN15441_c0_g1_i1:37-828(-)
MDSVVADLEQFRSLSEQSQLNTDQCKPLLTKLKIGLTKLDVPSPRELQNNKGEGVHKATFLAREILELGTLYSLRVGDEVAFERFVTQLKTFYFDYSGLLPASQKQDPILGVYLLYLLAENKIAEFHTQLELIPDHTNRYIRYSIELEQAKMEGSYNHILEAGNSFPVDYYAQFTQKLINTSRHDIADSLQSAYETLKLDDARSLLMLKDNSELEKFVAERKWTVKDNSLQFSSESDKETTHVDALRLIAQNLAYATELEQII